LRDPAHRDTQVVLHEGDQSDAVTYLRHADILAGKGMTDIHFVSLEANPAAMRDRDRRVVEGIKWLGFVRLPKTGNGGKHGGDERTAFGEDRSAIKGIGQRLDVGASPT
jgi:hypothetical protein